ncbi:MAG: MATE family efflux transporter [Lachnospiraceae bacterium]|nr:MATE family efflux transporter [Lachnospiraceae bacterium]
MNHDMTKGKIFPIILKFTWPLFLGNIFQQLYNMCDMIIVGRFVGSDALAAVGSTGTIMFLLIGFSIGITAGFAVMTSQRFGAGDEEGVKISVANGVLLSLIATVILTASGLYAMPTILHLMNTPSNIYHDASSYINIICMGLMANIFYNLLSSYLRAVGNSQAPLFFLVFSACLNVVLDLYFIIVLNMGVAGAARATILSQGISALLCLLYIGWKVKVLVPRREHVRINRDATVLQLKMGIPMALQFAITASGTMIMQAAINLFGSTAVAAFTAANKTQNLITQGMISMGQTMASYCGQNFGAGDYDRVEEGCKAAVKIEIVYSLLAALVTFLALPNMLHIFFAAHVDMNTILPWAREYAYLCMIFYIPLSLIFIYRNAMQGCGYWFLPMMGGVIELVSRCVMAFLGMHTHSYLLSVACDPAAWFFTGIYVVIAFGYVMKDMRRKHAQFLAEE